MFISDTHFIHYKTSKFFTRRKIKIMRKRLVAFTPMHNVGPTKSIYSYFPGARSEIWATWVTSTHVIVRAGYSLIESWAEISYSILVETDSINH